MTTTAEAVDSTRRTQTPGRRSRRENAALARIGVAAGADGLLVEVHPNPEKAVSDGAQSLTLEDFRGMMRQLRPYLELWKEARLTETAAAV